MKTRLSVAVLSLLLMLVSASARADGPQVSPEKRAEIEKLMQTTGALKIGQQLSAAVISELTDTLRKTHPNIPAKTLDMIPEVVNGVIADNIDGFKEVVIHIYDEHFTLEDLQGLNAFYLSDLGQKVVKSLPAVLQESMAAGRQWGEALGPQIVQRVKSRLKEQNIEL
ncbi:MAG TPA: DUF2059 domain-containing protein [Steroidobacteraceae bacterium]|jgi:hypothetical protein|nr:DUF2059 domain-containing protein [Steroidobacteraceae bacterium]